MDLNRQTHSSNPYVNILDFTSHRRDFTIHVSIFILYPQKFNQYNSTETLGLFNPNFYANFNKKLLHIFLHTCSTTKGLSQKAIYKPLQISYWSTV